MEPSLVNNLNTLLVVNTTLNSTATINHVAKIIGWVTFAVGLPAIGLAIYVLKQMSKGQTKVPFYVISLLVSDIFNFIGRPQAMTETVISSDTTTLIFYFGIVSNVTFMVCIAQERHLLVTHPHCHGCCSRLKKSALVSLVIWGAPFAIVGLAVFKYFFWFAVALLVPFPFLLFFVLDAWRALFCCGPPSTRAERRRTVGGLVVILTNYTLLFLPFILNVLLVSLSFQEEIRYLGLVSNLLLYLSPLVDPFLYILMTQGPREVLRVLPCCKKESDGSQEGPRTSSTVATVSETCDTRL